MMSGIYAATNALAAPDPGPAGPAAPAPGAGRLVATQRGASKHARARRAFFANKGTPSIAALHTDLQHYSKRDNT
jgi:hypothetical protein